MDTDDTPLGSDCAPIVAAVRTYRRELRWLLHADLSLLVTVDGAEVPGCSDGPTSPLLHLQIRPEPDAAHVRRRIASVLGTLGYRRRPCEALEPPAEEDRRVWQARERRARVHKCRFVRPDDPSRDIRIHLGPWFGFAWDLSRPAVVSDMRLRILPFQDLWEARHRALRAAADGHRSGPAGGDDAGEPPTGASGSSAEAQ